MSRYCHLLQRTLTFIWFKRIYNYSLESVHEYEREFLIPNRTIVALLKMFTHGIWKLKRHNLQFTHLYLYHKVIG